MDAILEIYVKRLHSNGPWSNLRQSALLSGLTRYIRLSKYRPKLPLHFTPHPCPPCMHTDIVLELLSGYRGRVCGWSACQLGRPPDRRLRVRLQKRGRRAGLALWSLHWRYRVIFGFKRCARCGRLAISRLAQYGNLRHTWQVGNLRDYGQC